MVFLVLLMFIQQTIILSLVYLYYFYPTIYERGYPVLIMIIIKQ